MEKSNCPEKIICLTEESVELLYLLGEDHRIYGVSQFAVRPEEVKEKKVVSVFTHANIKKVLSENADLIIGYSDIQKDIARELIEKGQNVYISNHRSLQQTLNYCRGLANLVGADEKYNRLEEGWLYKIEETKKKVRKDSRRIKVYLEEWDDPRISGIHYFSELVELCGFVDIFAHKRQGVLAKDRFVDDTVVIKEGPEVILACWCGKKVDLNSFSQRDGWEEVPAVKTKKIYELPPEIFLQPGPALFESGIDYLMKLRSTILSI